MTYFQTVIDDFNDNVFNSSLWSANDVADLAETSNQMQLHATSGYPGITCSKIYDITTGIMAIKLLANIGTATSSTEFTYGVIDPSGNEVWINSTPVNNWYDFNAAGSATISTPVGEGAGMGTDWVAGNWLGLGNLGSDNILHFYKSTDGQTWTEIGHVTVGGTFNKTLVGMEIGCGCYSGSSTYKAVFDDPSYWSQTAPVASQGGFFDVM